MYNIDDIIFELDDEIKEIIADNPVTDALLSHLCLELESMNKPIDDWRLLTDITLAASAFCFYRGGGSSDEFLEKIQSIDIRPDISKLN